MKVVRVNLEERKIDFELLDKSSNQSHSGKKSSFSNTSDDRPKNPRTKKTRARKSGAKKPLTTHAKTKAKAGSSHGKRKRKTSR